MAHSSGNCPIAKVAAVLGDFCTVLIVRDLVGGPKRFKELHASLIGVSTRTLAKKLKVLEAEGMVRRKEFRESPPRVEYALTEKGRRLEKIVQAMKAYGARYMVAG